MSRTLGSLIPRDTHGADPSIIKPKRSLADSGRRLFAYPAWIVSRSAVQSNFEAQILKPRPKNDRKSMASYLTIPVL
jgi:hypothetical protein